MYLVDKTKCRGAVQTTYIKDVSSLNPDFLIFLVYYCVIYSMSRVQDDN